MAPEVFHRYEKKYLLDMATFQRMERRLLDYMEPDAHSRNNGSYSIANIYYDTADYHLIRTSLEKPFYKEKLRLRTYGVPQGDAKVYVEIKKKFDGLTNKRRSELRLSEAYALLQSGVIPLPQPYMNLQVLEEIACLLRRAPLQPATFLAYDRRAYFGVGQHDLRVSFDSNIRARQTHLRLEAGDFGAPIIPADTWIMEIKAAQSIPLWLCRLLSDLKLYPRSFSKYGRVYTQHIQPQHIQPQEGQPCSNPSSQPLPTRPSPSLSYSAPLRQPCSLACS